MIDLGATFLSSVDRCPEAIAITYQNKHLNYSNWLNKISSLAISLKKMGLRKGDRLMTLYQTPLRLVQFTGHVN